MTYYEVPYEVKIYGSIGVEANSPEDAIDYVLNFAEPSEFVENVSIIYDTLKIDKKEMEEINE